MFSLVEETPIKKPEGDVKTTAEDDSNIINDVAVIRPPTPLSTIKDSEQNCKNCNNADPNKFRTLSKFWDDKSNDRSDNEYTSAPRLYGGITLTNDKQSILELPPKYAIHKKVDKEHCEAEIEKSLAKLRWEHKKENDP